jgi:myo-inositol 2-dehydrogenase/D-chiro-inositol 1-dehydrogenase
MTPKLAFVGCGTHSTNNLYPALGYANCRLDAVCDRVRSLAERNAARFGAAAVYEDAERMLDERRPDGVLVVGPPHIHYEVGKLALSRGIPLYVEKPTAPNLAQARELVALARANRTFVMTGYMKRFGMPYAKARAMIRSGEFVPAAGSLKYGHWLSSDLDGMLHTMSVHIIDLALSLFGECLAVTSTTARSARNALTLSVTLRFRSGAIAHLMLDGSQPRIQERVELSGSVGDANALLIVDNVHQLELHRQGHHGVDVLTDHPWQIEPRFELDGIQVWRPDYAIPNMGQTRMFFQGFAGAVREFVAAIAERRDPYPSPEEALWAMEVIDAIIRQPDGTTELRPQVAAGAAA